MRPTAGITVQAQWRDRTYTAKTDSNGRYSILLPRGRRYEVVATTKGCLAREIHARQDQTVDLRCRT